MNPEFFGIKKTFWLAALILVSVCPLLAQEVPQPYNWVNDYAGVISPDFNEKITRLIKDVEEKTSSEITVVTVSSIAGYSEVDYARKLFDTWKPGKKGKDNGVLVLLAIKERRWRIEAGYGVEGVLPDGLCGEIGRNFMVPYFKAGKYSEGLFYGISEIARILGGGDPQLRSPAQSQGVLAGPFVYIFCFLFFLVWNLPWPVFFGLPFTLIFAFAFGKSDLGSGAAIIMGYLASMAIRYIFWRNLPPSNRPSFSGPQSYGAHSGSGYHNYQGGGSFSGGGFGGFGGGRGGGGGAGGGF
jgi:uncharacterized protein